MSFQAFLGAFIFAAISYLNLFVLSHSFFTIFTGIATAIIAALALLVGLMMLFSKSEKAEENNNIRNQN